MPFINQASRDEILGKFRPYEHVEESSFGEVFAASLGQVFDEELSISSALNREGWDRRRELIREKIKAGEVPNIGRYRIGRARTINYSKIAEDLEDPAIKTDAQLNEERNELLASRRRYAQDVISRGSGMAQFLGAMNGYVLDPVNVVTLGVGTSVTAARGVSAIGRAALTARNAAVVEGVTELGIQTLVYQHKHDIESPYSAGDALANIGLAATGAAALGAASGGLSGWLENVLKVADEVPQTDEVVTAKDYVTRTRDNLKNAPKADTPEGQVESDIEFLRELNRRAEINDKPAKTVEMYQPRPDNVEPIKKPPASASQRERDVLTRQGIADEYDEAIAEFNELENPTLRIDDEELDPRALIEQYDDEIKGLDDVLRCVYG